MNNPFIDYPISGESELSRQACPSKTFSIANLIWFVSGICTLLAVGRMYLSEWVLMLVLFVDLSLFLGCGILLLSAVTILIASPFVYFSRHWFLRAILIAQCVVTSFVLMGWLLSMLIAFLSM